MGWTIRREGSLHVVAEADGRRETVLVVDDVEVDRGAAGYWETVTLASGDRTFEARWGPRNDLVAVHLVEDGHRVPLAPPPGSRQARREDFALQHPRWFVLGRVAAAAGQIVLGVLGVSALLKGFFGHLLPRLDLSWLPRPDLPSVSAPGWLRYVDPLYWLSRWGLGWPDVSVPAWLEPVLGTSTYWLPLVVALLVGLGELERRRTVERERERDSNGEGHDQDD
jgi:hypothetical protein